MSDELGLVKWACLVIGVGWVLVWIYGTIANLRARILGNPHCSFCRRSYRECGPFAEGPKKVFICDSCIDLSRAAIDEDKRRRGIEPTEKSNAAHPADQKDSH